uniref:Uncharacterized protein n=1 Tax=Terrapene triunguis TaxID=2587831 RepID=A0A674K733_9SAUR
MHVPATRGRPCSLRVCRGPGLPQLPPVGRGHLGLARGPGADSVSLASFQVGFFKRSRPQQATVPQYHAIKIPREERQLFREEKTGTIQRKEWVTNWSEGGDSHVPISADPAPYPGLPCVIDSMV